MTKKLSKDLRVSDILDAAVQEFVEHGYENTSMESIAMRAGLSKGGIYHHFKGKVDVLIKANDRFMEPAMAMMAEAQAAPNAVDGLTLYIKRYLTYWVAHPNELSFIFLSMTKTISMKELWHLYDGYCATLIAFFESMYERAVAAGEFRPLAARALSVSLMAALDGILGYLVLDKDLSLSQTITDLTEVFVNTYTGGNDT
jgi:AcrR family transcriptional regulator